MKKLAFLAFSAFVFASTQLAFADGMPQAKTAKPAPVILPLDEAINQIENKEPPAEAVKAPEPVIEQVEPAQMAAAPVPESRTVEVPPNSSFFGLSMGIYNVGRNDDNVPVLNAEWQPGVRIAGFLQPIFGAFATTKGTMMGYGGVGVPVRLSKHVFLMPSVAVGAYKQGAGYDLGQTLAFRVGTEVGYEFENRSRLGLNAHVITNGDSANKIDRTHIISLVYTMPMDIFSGRSSRPNIGPAIPPQQ